MLGDRTRTVNRRTTGLGRFLFVMLTMAAWVSISNHCVLGSLIAFEAKTSVAPMHCHGDRPAPAKNGDEQTPCCKVLKAVTVAKVHAGTNQLDFALKEYSTGELAVEIWQAHTRTHPCSSSEEPPAPRRRVVFRLNRAGRWLLRGTDVRKAVRSDADWESDFATLTLEVKQK